MFSKLRSKITRMLTKVKTVRNPQPKFVNPYAMSESVTQQLPVKPEFKDGRFILTPQSSDPRIDNIPPEVPKEEPKKPKVPGITKYIKDVIVSDMGKISGESRRKIKVNPIIKKEDEIIYCPPAMELEIIECEIIEPEIIEPEIIEPEIITTTTIDPIPLDVIDVEAIEFEEEKDLEELESVFKSVDQLLNPKKKEQTQSDAASSYGETNSYVKTALQRAEAYKKQEGGDV